MSCGLCMMLAIPELLLKLCDPNLYISRRTLVSEELCLAQEGIKWKSPHLLIVTTN